MHFPKGLLSITAMPRVSVTVPDLAPQPYRFPLDRELVTLGRGEDNDILLESGSVSSYHAEMVRVHGGYELRDLGSTNGIKRHDERYGVIPLVNGEVVQIGDVDFHFTLTPEEEAELAKEAQPQVVEEFIAPVSVTLLQAGEPVSAAIPQVPVATPQFQPRPAAPSYYPQSRPAATFSPVLCVVLAVAAFAGGLAYRHHKETGKSLIDAIQHGASAKPAPAAKATPAQP